MVTGLTIYQDNIIGSINAMAVHSPLVFLIDVDYTETAPDFIYCEVFSSGISILTVRCIYVQDNSDSQRRFKFVADEILRSLTPSFDDYSQTGQSIELATNINREFNLVFKDDIAGTHQINVLIDAVNASRQVGQTSTMTDVCANTNTIYIGGANKPVYVYFYNTQGGTEPPENTSYALDYNDDIFVDYNDDRFTITDI